MLCCGEATTQEGQLMAEVEDYSGELRPDLRMEDFSPQALVRLRRAGSLFNPRVKVGALKLPPRGSPDEIACQWEFAMEA